MSSLRKQNEPHKPDRIYYLQIWYLAVGWICIPSLLVPATYDLPVWFRTPIYPSLMVMVAGKTIFRSYCNVAPISLSATKAVPYNLISAFDRFPHIIRTNPWKCKPPLQFFSRFSVGFSRFFSRGLQVFSRWLIVDHKNFQFYQHIIRCWGQCCCSAKLKRHKEQPKPSRRT